jgi:hypothetical protein
MNVIIFSKNRPMQLYALLESIELFWKDHPTIKVLYTYDYTDHSDDYEPFYMGYNIVFNKFYDRNKYWFVHESGFKDSLYSLINKEKEFTMFLVDDNLFIRPFNNNYINSFKNPFVLSYSNRLSPKINYCFSENISTEPPKELIYNYRNYKGDFGYPMSLDGNIFKTVDIIDFIRLHNFNSPNNLEVMLSQTATIKPLMAISEETKIIGVPYNSVQKEYNNTTLDGFDHRELNELFLDGKKIDIDPYLFLENDSPHVDILYTFKWRE